jgi:hypothetical protein
MPKPRRKLPPVRSRTLRRKGNYLANPYPRPELALETPRASKVRTDLSDEAQLGKPADEPIFVLRASDRLSGMLVRAWANMAAELGLQSPDALADARKIALAMDEWRRERRP